MHVLEQAGTGTPLHGADEIQTRRARLIALAAGLLITGGVALLLLLNPDIEPVWDQTFIGYRLTSGYPSYEEGIVSHLLVGLVNAAVPYEPASSNLLIRTIAAVLYVGAAGLLAWTVTGPQRLWGFVLFLLLLVSARYPFLWLSSELFAGTLLMLFLWSFVRGHAFAVTAAIIVLFTFCKPDLVLPGALIGVYLVARRDTLARWRRAVLLGGMAALVFVPTLFFSTPYYAQFGGRSWVSFGQHYGDLVREHQLDAEPPSGWTGWLTYVQSGFPGTGSVREAALRHPRRYLHFVSLSIGESGIRALKSGLLLLLPIAAFLFLRTRATWRIPVLLFLSSFVPIVLLSYLHVRYQARFYPLMLFVIFAGLRDATYDARHGRIITAALLALLLVQLALAVPVFRSAYWLPD